MTAANTLPDLPFLLHPSIPPSSWRAALYYHALLGFPFDLADGTGMASGSHCVHRSERGTAYNPSPKLAATSPS
jgi:hypothetical protein